MRSKRSIKLAIGKGAIYVGLTLFAVMFIFPFYWLLISAFKPQSAIFAMPPQWIPRPGIIGNFTDLFRETNLLRAFMNSVIISAGNVSLALFLCSLAGYAFAKYPRAPGHGKLLAFVLSTMMIPGAVTLIPSFYVMVKLHLINSYWAMIIPGTAGAFGIFWMRQYMAAHLPDDLVNAARIDGCTEFGIYWKIAAPIAKPAVVASPPAAANPPRAHVDLTATKGYDALDLIFDAVTGGSISGAVGGVMDMDKDADDEAVFQNMMHDAFTPPVGDEVVPVVGDLGGPVDEIM